MYPRSTKMFLNKNLKNTYVVYPKITDKKVMHVTQKFFANLKNQFFFCNSKVTLFIMFLKKMDRFQES